ncbi:MAG: hypothetical protein ACT4SY_02225 [Hyphomicrobiales bacterium]
MKPNVLRVALSALLLSAAAGIAFAENNGRAPDGPQAPTPQAVVSGACTDLTKANFISDDSINKSTSSNNFVNVPNAGVSFNQGGTGNGCVIVTFTAEAFARVSRLLQIRARLENGAIAAPGVVQLSGDDDEDRDGDWARAHAFTFIFPSVAPGAHTVRMQFRSVFFFEPVTIHKHTVVVQHR